MPALILIKRSAPPAITGDYTLVVEAMKNVIAARQAQAVEQQQAILFVWPEWTCLGAFSSPWKALKAAPKGAVLFEFLADGAVRIDIAGTLFLLRSPLIPY